MTNHECGPLEELRIAKRHPAASVLGALGGAIVPIYSFAIVHCVENPTPYQWGLVLACLAYSSQSVWHWMRNALSSSVKAGCFVVLLEGGMIVGGISWLSWTVLFYLVFINATHTATTLAKRDMLDKAGSTSFQASAELPLPAPQPALEQLAKKLEPDALYEQAVAHVRHAGVCSTSALQRALKVGYPRAAKLVERMEREGLIGPAKSAGRHLAAPESAEA
jgi:hypothetical protein